MASAYYGLNRGQNSSSGSAAGTQAVTESATATGSTDIEIRIDKTKSLTQAEIYSLIQQLNEWILKNGSKFLVG